VWARSGPYYGVSKGTEGLVVPYDPRESGKRAELRRSLEPCQSRRN